MEKVYAIIKLILVALIVLSTVMGIYKENKSLRAYDTWLTVTTVSGFVAFILFTFDAVVKLIK